jgi:hypothetical protein
MFTLRDRIVPNESGTATASLTEYQVEVGGICDDVNAAERSRAREVRGLGPRLKRAATTVRQRNLLLDGVNRSIARGVDESSHLAGLAVPEELGRSHAATVDAWQRNVDRVRAYAHRLDIAETRRRLEAAVAYLATIRGALSRDGTVLRAGLVRLGGDSCRLNAPIVTKTITLPPVGRRPTAIVAAVPPSVTTPTLTQMPSPPATAGRPARVPESVGASDGP